MKRVEIIFNQMVREDFFDFLQEKDVNNFHYTELLGIQGKGRLDEKRGNTVWPEENVIILAYVNEDMFLSIQEAFYFVKRKFKNSGLKMYVIDNALEIKLQ